MIRIFIKQLVFIIVILMLGCSRDNGPPTVNISSDDAQFRQLSDKVDFLEQYVGFRRRYLALDFYIDYHNNSGGLVPGPSDWYIGVVAKIPQTEIAQWTKGLLPIKTPNIDWVDSLPGSIDRSGISTWYQSDYRLLGVDEKNAIIVYRNRTM
jgi:hypothetical protein